jgi:CheY-like chemotaxis protein
MTLDANAQFSKLSILVVEDNAFTTIVISKTLKSLGISRIETAADGREALDKISQYQPDVILLDLRLPVMGGVELISRLSDQNYDGHIILMSGVEKETLSTVEQLAFEKNISILGGLQKPPSASDLSDLLMKALAE